MNKQIVLNDGNKIPVIGIGTYKAEPHLVGEAVEFAITKAGYQHVDCASIYGNQKEIGEALQRSQEKIDRQNLFVTSKLWSTDHRAEYVEKACKQTLLDLRLDYLDLYLMHWGIALMPGLGSQEPLGKDGKAVLDNVSIRETWEAMEELVHKGLVKSIGISNFTTPMIVDLLTYAKLTPVVNQIELHPYNTQEELIDFCRYKKIETTAYSPLGRQGIKAIKGPRIFDELIVQSIAKKYNKTLAQVLLNWAIKRGTIVIPKSTDSKRISENIQVFDFELSDAEMQEISTLNKNHRFVHPGGWWGIPYFS
jgi:diketogulonate reductase-like aldo/keto reductase